jgi:predicted HTH transcriptional regulator
LGVLLDGVAVPWHRRSLAEQVRRLEKKVEREKIVLATQRELSIQIVEFAREHGRVTMADAVKLTEANRNSLKQHFRHLVARGYLQQQGSGRGAWYGLG